MENLNKALLLKNELDTLRPLNKDDEQRIMQKFRLDWNYHSNNLEGNSLTYGETKALILFGITANAKPFKDTLEIKGHNEAINWVLDIVKQERPITENFIRELHELILKEPYEVDAITPDGKPTKKLIQIGKYKTSPNHVKTNTGEMFYFASPEETPSKMGDLMAWYVEKIESKDTNPIILAAEFHYRFIRIHPFDDGNGRVARILMNFILMQKDFPPVVIKTEDKENYFAVLRQADAGVFEPFADYIAKNLVHSLEIMIKGAKGESIEEVDDLEKEIVLLEQRLKGESERINLLKTKELVFEIIENTVLKIADQILLKSKKIDEMYVESELIIDFDSLLPINLKETDFREIKRFLFHNIHNVNLSHKHKNIRYQGYKYFEHFSNVSFNFGTKEYFVSNSEKCVFKKEYSEILTDEEINQLVNSEIRKHKEFIEQKIEENKKENQ